MIISSQRHLDDQIVAAKQAAQDYTVTLSPKFEIDGMTVQVVTDGHHSLAAAVADGVSPDFVVASVSADDRIGLLDRSVEDYMQANWIDSDWYDVSTGGNIW